MSRVKIYFMDNHTLTVERDKVAFSGGGIFFDFCETDRPDEEKRYSALLNDGRVLVNWDNVCFVVEDTEEKKDPYEE